MHLRHNAGCRLQLNNARLLQTELNIGSKRQDWGRNLLGPSDAIQLLLSVATLFVINSLVQLSQRHYH